MVYDGPNLKEEKAIRFTIGYCLLANRLAYRQFINYIYMILLIQSFPKQNAKFSRLQK